MSPLEFHYAAKGYWNKHWQQWDMVRHQMYTVAGTVKSKKRLPKLSIWFPWPIDNNTGISNERANDVFKMLKEKINGKRTAG
jgi:hypothetical protein